MFSIMIVINKYRYLYKVRSHFVILWPDSYIVLTRRLDLLTHSDFYVFAFCQILHSWEGHVPRPKDQYASVLGVTPGLLRRARGKQPISKRLGIKLQHLAPKSVSSCKTLHSLRILYNNQFIINYIRTICL